MLVVDDQVFNIEFLRCQIELIPSMQGCCDYADHGQAAIDLVANNLKMLKENPTAPKWVYSLILLDYSMPKMDGPTTAMHICDLYKKHGVEIPHIVCLTAFTEKIFEDKARESGMAEFISKPINNAKLKKIMRECNLINQAEAN
jgi:CheY-like chemotaxis protein